MSTSGLDTQYPSQTGQIPLVQLIGVHQQFLSHHGRDFEALQDVCLAIPAHSFVTIVGASGSGKTTLLNLVAGLLQPTSGRIQYHPKLNLKTDLAYVFQHYTLLPWRTVLKNIAFGLELRGMPRQQRFAAARQWIERVGLQGFENAYPHELSGGMRQRTAIAQALAIQPKLLLMDEPFGSLDDNTRTELQQVLIQLQAGSKTTILFVTHNIDEAITLADRIVVFSKTPGRVLAQIQTDSIKSENRTDKEFTDLFIKIRNLIA
ncbi:MAG: ABC transporter ATP-binding protein [Sedimentisphaerales bacterium]|nr:ABC transporter ATP-binding protein [Sedimentisphaerales bacterium]